MARKPGNGGIASGKDAGATPEERYSGTANRPPIDPRKPPADPRPGSHSTGGRKDHEIPGEGEGPERPAETPRP